MPRPKGQARLNVALRTEKKADKHRARARPFRLRRRDTTGSAPVCRPCAHRPSELPRGTYRRA
eukprot:9478157-Pyramimonas_sp.AAC.1